jgi:hypothetical protein
MDQALITKTGGRFKEELAETAWAGAWGMEREAWGEK